LNFSCQTFKLTPDVLVLATPAIIIKITQLAVGLTKIPNGDNVSLLKRITYIELVGSWLSILEVNIIV